MPYSESIRQTGYAALESTYGTVPSFTNTDAFRFVNLSAVPQYGNIERPDKTGSYSQTVPIADNKGGTWSMSASIVGSGTAGTIPDHSEFYEAALGKKTVTAGTSVVYDPDDLNPTLSIMARDQPTSVDQLIALGCIVQQARFILGSQIPQMEFSGISRWVLNKDLFASTDTAGKGGLVSFPSEPASPVTNGTPPRGRTGVITLDGNAYLTFRSANVTIATGRTLSDPDWGSAYPGDPQSGRRSVTFDFSLYDDDSANLAALKGKALSKTPVTISFQIGAVAGNIFTITLRNVVLPMPAYNWGDLRRTVEFSGCRAAATSATSKNECSISWT